MAGLVLFVIIVGIGFLLWLGAQQLAAAPLVGQQPKPAPRPAPPQAAAPRVPPLPERFVVLDLETTGLHADRHEIIEIGAIKFHRDRDSHPSFQCFVVPRKRISGRITQLTGLDRKLLVREGIALAEALPALIAFCEDLPLVAFNARFDRGFVEAACRQLGCPPPRGQWVCALELARSAWPGRSSYRLSALAASAGIALDDEHRALADCRRAGIIYASALSQLHG